MSQLHRDSVKLPDISPRKGSGATTINSRYRSPRDVDASPPPEQESATQFRGRRHVQRDPMTVKLGSDNRVEKSFQPHPPAARRLKKGPIPPLRPTQPDSDPVEQWNDEQPSARSLPDPRRDSKARGRDLYQRQRQDVSFLYDTKKHGAGENDGDMVDRWMFVENAPQLSKGMTGEGFLRLMMGENTILQLPQSRIPPEYRVYASSILQHTLSEQKEKKEEGTDDYNEDSKMFKSLVFPSVKPTSRVEVFHLTRALEQMLASLALARAHREDNRVSKAESNIYDLTSFHEEFRVWDTILSELVRQVFAHCQERGLLLDRVRTRLSTFFDEVVHSYEAHVANVDANYLDLQTRWADFKETTEADMVSRENELTIEYKRRTRDLEQELKVLSKQVDTAHSHARILSQTATQAVKGGSDLKYIFFLIGWWLLSAQKCERILERYQLDTANWKDRIMGQLRQMDNLTIQLEDATRNPADEPLSSFLEVTNDDLFPTEEVDAESKCRMITERLKELVQNYRTAAKSQEDFECQVELITEVHVEKPPTPPEKVDVMVQAIPRPGRHTASQCFVMHLHKPVQTDPVEGLGMPPVPGGTPYRPPAVPEPVALPKPVSMMTFDQTCQTPIEFLPTREVEVKVETVKYVEKPVPAPLKSPSPAEAVATAPPQVFNEEPTETTTSPPATFAPPSPVTVQGVQSQAPPKPITHHQHCQTDPIRSHPEFGEAKPALFASMDSTMGMSDTATLADQLKAINLGSADDEDDDNDTVRACKKIQRAFRQTSQRFLLREKQKTFRAANIIQKHWKKHQQKYEVPMSFSHLLSSKPIERGRVKPRKTILKTIAALYSHKFKCDTHDEKDGRGHQPFQDFIYDWFLKRYGLRKLAEKALVEFIRNLTLLRRKVTRVNLFCSFIGINETENYQLDTLDFFLYSLHYLDNHSGLSLKMGEEDKGSWIPVEHAIAIIQCVNPSITEDQLEQSMRKGAFRRDSASVHFDEFYTVAIPEWMKLREKHIGSLKALFAAADYNNNGMLSWTEFVKLSPLLSVRIESHRRLRLFREVIVDSEAEAMTLDSFIHLGLKYRFLPREWKALYDHEREAEMENSVVLAPENYSWGDAKMQFQSAKSLMAQRTMAGVFSVSDEDKKLVSHTEKLLSDEENLETVFYAIKIMSQLGTADAADDEDDDYAI